MKLTTTLALAGPWLIALAPAWFVFEAMTTKLTTPWFIALPVAAGVECTGVAAFHTALRLLSWNRSRRKTDPAAPVPLGLALVAIYLVSGIILTAVLKNDWTLSIFFVLAGAGYAVIALSADQDHRETAVETERAEAREARRVRRTFTERPAPVQSSAERSPDLDERLRTVVAASGPVIKRSDVEQTAGLGKTAAAGLIRYGLDTGQLTEAGRYMYEYTNGRE